MFTSNNFLKGTSERENRRILYINYSGEPITPKNPTERQQQVALKKLIDGPLSATAGEIVRIGAEFQQTGFLEVINKWEPFVIEATNGLTSDLGLHYAILHWFTRKMFEAVGRNPNRVDSFFMERLAGTISTLQPTTSREEVMRAPPQLSLLDQVRKDVVDTVTTLPEEQLKNMFQIGSYVQNLASVDAVVVHRDFYLGKPYTSKTVHACLKTTGEGLGKSQSRQWNGVSTPTTLVAQSSFDKDELIKIKTAMGNLKKSSATHQTTSPRPMEADEIRTSPSPISTAVTITSPSPMVRTSPTPTSTDKVRTDSARTSPSPTPADVSRTCPSPMSTAVTRTSTSPMVRTSPTPTSVDMERRSVSPTSANVRTTSTTDVLPKTDNRCEHAAKQRTLINSLLQRFSRPAPISPDPVSEEIEQTINLETIETIPLPKKQGHKTPLWDAAADPSTRSLEAVGLIPVETCSRLLDKQQKKKGRKRRLRATQTSTKTTAKKPRGKQIEHSGQN